GTDVNQSFITGVNKPTGIAVDGTHIYWATYSTNSIGRANLDGTGVNQSFISGAEGPIGVAVDATYIYWDYEVFDAIGRANLDGTGVNQNFITGVRGPGGIAVFVPEPSTGLLVFAGLLGLAGWRRARA